MDNKELVKNWHSKIISICEEKLDRQLSEAELRFIRSRGGFMALEMIEDTVLAIAGRELEEYLNSEE